MKTIKKNNGVFYVVISLVVVGLLAMTVTVSAGSTFKDKLVDAVAKIIAPQIVSEINAEVPEVISEDGQLGSVTGPDYYWDYQNFNGLTTYVKTGGFADATTTLACVKNPFNATSTVDLAEVLVTGISTTTIALSVGTSTVNVGLTTTTIYSSALSIMTVPTITASTKGVATNNYNIGVTGTYAAGTVAKMSVDPLQYVCFVAGEGSGGSVAGVVNGGNTFKGEYKLRFYK